MKAIWVSENIVKCVREEHRAREFGNAKAHTFTDAGFFTPSKKLLACVG
jgi:hypothetical protein